MARIILETRRGNRVDIVPHPAGKRLFLKFVGSAPEEVELLHVKWSGDALFFFHTLPVVPTSDELTRTLDPGSFAYFPDLEEFILAYGEASPRDKRGNIEVARVGTVTAPEALVPMGKRIWRHGMEAARIRVEP